MILVSGLLSVVWLGFYGVESNPGLCMCYIGVLPLSYTPDSDGQRSVVLKSICVTKTCCPSLCCLLRARILEYLPVLRRMGSGHWHFPSLSNANTVPVFSERRKWGYSICDLNWTAGYYVFSVLDSRVIEIFICIWYKSFVVLQSVCSLGFFHDWQRMQKLHS